MTICIIHEGAGGELDRQQFTTSEAAQAFAIRRHLNDMGPFMAGDIIRIVEVEKKS